MIDFPPAIVVIHPRERKAKCTVRPLKDLPGFEFRRYPLARPIPEGYVRLGFGGAMLSRLDAAAGLLVLDGTWRWAAQMERQLEHVPIRSLPAFETAYPRNSKVFDDPSAGLATVEAIFLANALLGRSTGGILDRYYWREEFLARNAERFLNLGIRPSDLAAIGAETGDRDCRPD